MGFFINEKQKFTKINCGGARAFEIKRKADARNELYSIGVSEFG